MGMGADIWAVAVAATIMAGAEAAATITAVTIRAFTGTVAFAVHCPGDSEGSSDGNWPRPPDAARCIFSWAS